MLSVLLRLKISQLTFLGRKKEEDNNNKKNYYRTNSGQIKSDLKSIKGFIPRLLPQ